MNALFRERLKRKSAVKRPGVTVNEPADGLWVPADPSSRYFLPFRGLAQQHFFPFNSHHRSLFVKNLPAYILACVPMCHMDGVARLAG